MNYTNNVLELLSFYTRMPRIARWPGEIPPSAGQMTDHMFGLDCSRQRASLQLRIILISWFKFEQSEY